MFAIYRYFEQGKLYNRKKNTRVIEIEFLSGIFAI